jgi:hypothetical protein
MRRTVKAEIVHRTTGEKATATITVETEGNMDPFGLQLIDDAKGKLMSYLSPAYRSLSSPSSSLDVRMITDDGVRTSDELAAQA